MISTFVFSVLLAAGGAPEAGQAEQPAAEASMLICRRIPELGSRVRAQRVCKTRQEWAVERQENRQALERAQVNRSTAGGN